MNREIKFRGLSEETGKWLYGCYVTDGKDYHAIFPKDADDEGLRIEKDVNKESVGQFIGQKDKNGIETYEHDNVTHKHYADLVFTVSYSVACGEWHLVGDSIGLKMSRSEMSCIKVIGNIHEQGEKQ